MLEGSIGKVRFHKMKRQNNDKLGGYFWYKLKELRRIIVAASPVSIVGSHFRHRWMLDGAFIEEDEEH